ARELYYQDGVLARERDHQDQADLRVQVVVVAAARKREDDPHQGHGNDEDDRGGRRPALVQGGQHQGDEGEGERVNEVRLVADLLFLVARGSPLVGHALRQRLARELLHGAEGLPRAEPASGGAEYGRRRVQVVARDQLGPLSLLDLDQC